MLDVRGVSGRAAREGVQLPGPRGRGASGSAGSSGAGRSELLRLIYGLEQPGHRRGLPRRQEAAGRPPGRRDRARHGPRPGGPQVPGPAARLEPGQERQRRRPRPLHDRRAGSACSAEREAGRRQAARAQHGAGQSGPDHARALGRQPAEGRARALAAARVPRPAARRADARRRRRRQGRDLPADRRAVGGGHRDRRRLLRDGGADGAEHPHPDHARGRARRRGRRGDARPRSSC